MLVGIGSLRCVSGWPTMATVLVDSVGVTSSPAPGAITAAPSPPPGPDKPASASASASRSRAVSGCTGSSSWVAASAASRPTSGRAGQPAGRGAGAPDVVSRERGTATQRSSNSGRYSGAYRSVSSSLNPSLDSEVG